MLFTLVLRAGVPPGMMGVDGAPATQVRAELELGGAAQRRGWWKWVHDLTVAYYWWRRRCVTDNTVLLIHDAPWHTSPPPQRRSLIRARLLICATCEMSQNPTVERYPLTYRCVWVSDRDSDQTFESILTKLCTQVLLGRKISVQFMNGQHRFNRFKITVV